MHRYTVRYTTQPFAGMNPVPTLIQVRVNARDDHEAERKADEKLCRALPGFDPRLREVISVTRRK